MTGWVSEAEFAVIVETFVVWAVYPVWTGTTVNAFQKVADVFAAENNCNKNKEFVVGNEPGYEERYVKEVIDFAKFCYGGKEFSNETPRREFGLEFDF